MEAASIEGKEMTEAEKDASSGTVQVPRLVATAPKRIYLGVFDDVGVEQQDFPEDHEGITWCTDNVGHADVEYIRADLAAAPGAK